MIGYVLYRAGEGLASILGRRGSYWLACRIADLRHAQSRKNREVIRHNLSHVLDGEPAAHIRSRSRRAHHHFAKSIADFLRVRFLDTRFFVRHVRVSGLEHLKAALKRGKGVLLVSSHMGNWEMGAAILSRLGFQVHAFALPHAERKVNEWFDRQRRKAGVQVISARSGLRRCLELLRQNKIVAILGDKDFTGGHGVVVNFFGRPTEFPRGPAAITFKTGASFMPVFSLRDPRDDYELSIMPSLEAERGEEPEQDLTRLTQKFASILEKVVGSHPEQWTLFQPMWNHVLS